MRNPRVAIITAVASELAALRNLLNLHDEFTDPQDGSVYMLGTFRNASARENCAEEWDVILPMPTSAGNVLSAIATIRTSKAISPDIIMFIGCAGGIPGKTNLYDVVVADKIIHYEPGKSDVDLFPRPDQARSTHKLLERAKAELHSDRWLGYLPQQEKPAPPPVVRVEPIAAGELLIKNSTDSHMEHVRLVAPRAVAVEQEGYGVLMAAHQNGMQAIVVRGISDLLDDKGADATEELSSFNPRQLKATHHAGAFALSMLANLDVSWISDAARTLAPDPPQRIEVRPAPRPPSPVPASKGDGHKVMSARHVWQRTIAWLTGLLALCLSLIIGQHLIVSMYRYPSNMIMLAGGTFSRALDQNSLIAIMRKYSYIQNLELFTAEPPAQQQIGPYYIDRFEVTNYEFKQFVATGKAPPIPQQQDTQRFGGDKQPVVHVDWRLADAYCNWRGKRLPTSDEWERAARGANGRLYPWGDSFDAARTNTVEGAGSSTYPVGAVRGDQSIDGVFDLAGNVAEWTSEERLMRDDKLGKVVRGASWRRQGEIYSLGFSRVITDPLVESNEIGFRCAKDVSETVQSDMVRIPGGSFEKGSGNSFALNLIRKYKLTSDAIRRLVRVNPTASTANFAIDRFEVTNADYSEFLRATADRSDTVALRSNKKNYEPKEQTWNDYRFNQPSQPVVGVDWYDAEAYCRWSEKRLPTSIEWERGAAGMSGRRYPWGDNFEPDRCNAAETIPNQRGTAPVGKFSRCVTSEGVFDMAGNADEWTDSDAPANGPRTRKIIRGGSWSEPIELRGLTSFESMADAEYRGPDVGFRCAMDPRSSWLETIMRHVRM